MELVKRDRVNRVTGLVYLPIDGSRLVKGSIISLENIIEQDIAVPFILDSMEMAEPVNGNAVGDAVFDAELVDSPDGNVFDAGDMV